MKSIPLIERAIVHGDRTAVRTTSETRSYADIARRSHAVASTLLEGDEDLNESRVAYLIPAGFDHITTQWGIWRAGGIAVPLSHSAAERELEYTLTDSGTGIVVADHDSLQKVKALCDRHDLRLVSVGDVDASADAPLPEITPGRRAMILYTSGTTSRPKGVVTTHTCIQAQIESLIDAWHWEPDDRIPLFLPLHHVHGIINVMSCALWAGAQVEAFPRFDLDIILRRVTADAYTMFMAVPTIYVRLIGALEAMPEEEREPVVSGFAKMRLMVSGSAALPATVHEQWTRLTGRKLLERYGMTEIGMALSNPYDGDRRPGAVGQPLPGVEVRLQSEGGSLITEENAPGEIQVRGPSVFREYWNRPDVTAESFEDGWFRTGDVAVLEDGYYRIMGRSSVDIIKSGGHKLSALEIEAALLDHPSIGECAVVGVPDETWGEIVAAAVVIRGDEPLELETLQSWCRDRIAHEKIPRRLLTVPELPRNAMGKVTKPAVLKLFEAAVSDAAT